MAWSPAPKGAPPSVLQQQDAAMRAYLDHEREAMERATGHAVRTLNAIARQVAGTRR